MVTDFIVKNRASVWLTFAVLIISAAMMHPSFATLIALAIETGLLVALRFCAHVEGRSS
jgi:hypothetical protein